MRRDEQRSDVYPGIACSAVSRGILSNITNMEEDEKSGKTEPAKIGPKSPQRESLAQEKRSAAPMETAEMSEDEQQQRTAAQLRAMAVNGGGSDEGGSSSVGGGSNGGGARGARPGDKRSETDSPCGQPANADQRFDERRNKAFVKTSAKFDFSGGSGSGDQDGMVSMEDGTDVAAKKRKTRRGKPKHRKLKPYSKQLMQQQQQQQQQQSTYQQRSRGGRPTSGRCGNQSSKGSGRQFPAPYNTNQFLMEDHNDLPNLDQKFSSGPEGSAIAGAIVKCHNHYQPGQTQQPARTRDSSFSVDSDEDFFYSSPEDEEEFLTKEFSTAYEDLHAERLNQLSKSELIQEYIQLEAKVDSLAKRLKSRPQQDSEASKRQLKIYQQKIDELVQQNEQLRKENESLKQHQQVSAVREAVVRSPVSSVDSESDSSTTSTGTDCSGRSRKSPLSSPMPSSYNIPANRMDQKTCRKNATSISSFDNESDCKSSDEEASERRGAEGKVGTIASPSSDLSNGHGTSIELIEMPT